MRDSFGRCVLLPQTVRVRKYDVDIPSLQKCLSAHKNMSCTAIAEKLNIPVTQIQHYFRKDKYFAIPDPEIWYELKKIFGITTNEFDDAIMTFEYRDGVFDMSERIYSSLTHSQTLLSGNEDYKIITYEVIMEENKNEDWTWDVDGEPTEIRIRKLTPKECWRLMGFDDESFLRAEQVNSNCQLYKQAGNSICVPVLEAIFSQMM